MRLQNPFNLYLSCFVLLFLFTTFIGTFFNPLNLTLVFLSINLSCLLLFGFDKRISPTKMTRIPERLFWFFAAIGGAPSLLLGIWIFRHKTRKASFQLVLAFIVVLQILIVKTFLIK